MVSWKVYIAILLITASEGGMNTIYSPYLEKANYTVEQIGWIVALFGVTQLIARLPVGALYATGKVKLLFAGFVALFIVTTVGFAYDGGAIYLIALTLAHGFAFGALGTLNLAWVIELKPANVSHGASMGWYTAALSAGYSIGNLSGGFLADNWGYAFAFIAIGLTPLFSILMSISLPSPAPTRVEKQNKKWELKDVGRAITPNLALATLIVFYLNVLDDGFASFFPLFGLSIGLSLTFIGLLRSLKSLTATALRPMSGAIFERINFKTLNNALIVAWAIATFLLPSLREPWMLAILFVIFGACRGLLRVTSATMIAEEKAHDTRGIGLASGIYNAGLDVGTFVGPILAGYVAALTDIPTMFRVVPLGLLALYFILAIWIARQPARDAARV